MVTVTLHFAHISEMASHIAHCEDISPLGIQRLPLKIATRCLGPLSPILLDIQAAAIIKRTSEGFTLKPHDFCLCIFHICRCGFAHVFHVVAIQVRTARLQPLRPMAARLYLASPSLGRMFSRTMQHLTRHLAAFHALSDIVSDQNSRKILFAASLITNWR